MEKYVLKFRIFLWVILACLTGWILYMGIIPQGKISYINDFTKSNYFIKKLTPEERVELPKNGSQILKGDPVYFTLHTPRRFNNAKLTLKYKNISEMPLIEAGVLVDETIWRYDLKPIENNLIDKLSLVWDVVREDGIVLLQRDISTTSEPIKNYNSVEDFLDNLPSNNEIATYNYNLDIDYILKDYEASDEEIEVNYALRGAYQFYTYIKNEDLDFIFKFSDLNENKDSDDIELNIYYEDGLIDSRLLEDSNFNNDDGNVREIEEVNLKLANLPEGAYKIELKANDDIVTEIIKSKQQKISFINKLWIYDESNENISLFTDSKNINAQTINPNKLQTIKIGERELEINKTYSQFNLSINGGLKEIILEKDDITISGNGIFSFCKDCIVNPKIKKVDENLDINNDGINYILARYNLPTEFGEWKIAEVEFDLNNVYREKNKYSFLISIPGLKADDPSASTLQNGGQAGQVKKGVEIGEIKVELEGTTIFEKIKKIIR